MIKPNEQVQASIDRVNRIMAKPFEERLGDWLVLCQAIVDKHREENFPTLLPQVLSIMKGKRYARIVLSETTPEGKTVHQSAWAFIDMTNGDVLKPTGWKAPAKHARGNIDDDQNGVGRIGPYGPEYLK